MKSEISSINDNIETTHSNKRMKNFKEDSLIHLKRKKKFESKIKQIKNFVPILKPKKSLLKPLPLQLNPEPFEKIKFHIISCGKKYKESENSSIDSNDFDEILSSSEDSSFDYCSSKKVEIETFKKDYSTSDKSPVISNNDENSY